MIKLVTVLQSAELNAEVWQIYESSFPEDERRDWLQLADLINHPLFHFKLILYGQSLIGIILVWKFNDFNFIEHFAIREAYGEKGLEQKSFNRSLQVEKPFCSSLKSRFQKWPENGFSFMNG